MDILLQRCYCQLGEEASWLSDIVFLFIYSVYFLETVMNIIVNMPELTTRLLVIWPAIPKIMMT